MGNTGNSTTPERRDDVGSVTAIERKLETARRRLLDISARNRLLNFRAAQRAENAESPDPKDAADAETHTRRRSDRRSLRLLAPDGEQLYRLLVTDERTVEINAADEGDESSPATATEPSLFDSESPPLAENHLHAAAQAALDEEQLRTRLLFLAREAESSLQEQGCNILFLAIGILEWLPTDAGAEPMMAPLILVPIEMVRRDVQQQYKIRWFDDAPVVNPTLVELCRSNFRLELPELNTESATPIEDLLTELEARISKIQGWSIHRQVHLGLFSFTKLLMYLDLNPARWPVESNIKSHPLIQALCGLGLSDGFAEHELISPADLDDRVPPQETFQVMDADSSQQVAILAAKRGTSMVIEGPPGTGKSQTITNIIAECLSAGKSVLFVAEKSAALEVVKRRLDKVGLGDFVLEMHSRKASKRQIMESLDRTLRADYPQADPGTLDAEELKSVRHRLNGYVRDLHQKIAPLEQSLFGAMGRCAVLRSATEAPFALSDAVSWNPQKYDLAQEIIARLSSSAGRIGNPSLHPWRGTKLTELPLHVQQQLPDRLQRLQAAIQQASKRGEATAQRLQTTAPACRKDAQQLIELVKAILAAPQLNPASIADPAWNFVPSEVATSINSGRRSDALRAALSQRWQPTAENQDWNEVLTRRTKQSRNWWRWLTPSWYRDTALIRRHLLSGQRVPQEQVLEDLQQLTELRDCRSALQSTAARCAELFGPLWASHSTNWDALQSYSDAVVGLRRLILSGRTTAAGIAAVCDDASRIELKQLALEFVAACNQMLSQRQELAELLLLDVEEFLGHDAEATSFDQWNLRLAECQTSLESLPEWIDFNRHRSSAAAQGLQPFLDWCFVRGLTVEPSHWPNCFQRQFLRLWLDRQIQAHPGFREFSGDLLTGLIDRFRKADEDWLQLSRDRLVSTVAARRPQQHLVASKNSKLGILQVELKKRRSLKPMRQLLSIAGDVVQSLKPCFMMSPISVAQYLEPGRLQFDVVIFDEASQVEPADAYGAVARGDQLILVGDEKQLPPTGFFTAANTAQQEEDDPESVDTSDLESILDNGQIVLPVKTRLRWHYRSRHNSLIEFSNSEFYQGELRVFPSPHFERNELGLSLRYLPQAVYQRGKGQFNPAEAQAVAQEVMAHAKHSPGRSLGVGAFSMAQQRAIEDEIEELRRESHDPVVEEFFASGRDEPFFVKNLETIQGDERDVILLSIGYGPDENRRVMMNFGPLNRDGGWRRLNVLITRAREKCLVFTSLKADQMRLEPSSPRGVRALKDFLQFAEYGTLPTISQYTNDHDSPFETDVCRAIRDAGWEVHAQVGCAGFAIDLAIVDPQAPGRYLLGIECDGATYHAAATARDRDRLRQAVLEGLGWKIYRIWSTDWFERRPATLDQLLAKVRDVAAQTRLDPNPSATESGTSESANRSSLVPDVESSPGAVSSPASRENNGAAEPLLNESPHPITQEDTAGPPPGIAQYRRYGSATRGDRNSLLRLKPADVAVLMSQVVEVEGPIHSDELNRVLAGMFNSRVTGQVQDLLTAAQSAGIVGQRFSRRGDFFWPAAMKNPPIRWRGNDGAVNAAELICSEEVAEAAIWVTTHEYGVPLDDLPAAAMRAMGFKRIGPQLAALGAAGVQLARESNRIAADPGGFMVATKES